MKIYSPRKLFGWGDVVPYMWAAEYIKENLPNCHITFCDNELEVPYREIMELPWADQLVMDNPNESFDYQLSMHHCHWFAEASKLDMRLGKPLFMDLHGFKFKMVHEGWYPTFKPTLKLEEEFKALKLPPMYNCWALSNDGSAMHRHALPTDFWVETNRYRYEDGLPFISVNQYVSNTIDCTKLHGWLKILVMIRANSLYGSQSGFTCIASMYRRREQSYLVNYNPEIALLTGPPAICYTNCEYRMNNDQYHSLHCHTNFDWTSYFPQFTHKNAGPDWFRTHPQFQGLEMENIGCKTGIYLPKVDVNRENCLVPLSTEFRLDNHPFTKLVPNNKVWAWYSTYTGQTI